MSKKMKCCMLLLVWGIVLTQLGVNYQQRKEQEPIIQTLAPTGAGIEEHVTGYGVIGNMELPESVKLNMMRNFGELLSVDVSNVIKEKNGDTEKWRVVDKTDKGEISICITTIKEKEKIEQVLFIESRQQIVKVDADSRFWSIGHLFQEIGVDGRVTVEQTMEQPGYQVAKLEEITESLFDSLEAKVVDEIRENGICTIYGYTKKESSYFYQNQQKVNVQLVLFYDRERDKTVVKLGIPLVNSVY